MIGHIVAEYDLAMLEVYTGFRPGRPTLLLFLSAGLLVGMLGLANFQVHEARALAPPYRLPGKPITFRPPKNWVPAPDDPGTFFNAVQPDPLRPATQRYERRLSIEFERLQQYVPPAQVLKGMGYEPRIATPQKIGKEFDALQVIQQRQMRFRNQMIVKERVARVASLPNGTVITAEYEPLLTLSEGDLDLFDHVCASIEIDDQYLRVSAPDALARAGIRMEVPAEWSLMAPEIDGAPGFFVSDRSGSTRPWSIALYRTWRSSGRSSEDLALDAAAEEWLAGPENLKPRAEQRSDGVELTLVERPASGHAVASTLAVAVIGTPSGETAIAFVYADPGECAIALNALHTLFQRVEFQPLAPFDQITEAASAGDYLAAELMQRGPIGWWGRERSAHEYVGDSSAGHEIRSVSRWAVDRLQLERGFSGVQSVRAADRAERETESAHWTLDELGVAYILEWRGTVLEGYHVQLEESRAALDAPVIRRLAIENGGRRTARFQPGRSFIGPPLEELAAERVCRLPGRTALIECSSPLGRGAHTRLLQARPEGDGWRVLELRDYRPSGRVLGFDRDDAPAYIEGPGGRLTRVAGQALPRGHSITI